MHDQFTWTQTTASQYAKWYASKVSNPLNTDKVEPEDFIQETKDTIITEDGIRLDKKKQRFWIVINFLMYGLSDEDSWNLKDTKVFSTQQKALDYITFNKPVLALKDVQEILVFQRNPDLINELVKICHERCHGLNKDK